MKEKRLINWCTNEKKINKKVTVKIISLHWLLKHGKNFLDFAQILQEYDKNNLFRTDLVRAMTNEYWTYYLRKIIVRTFLPWVAFSLTSLAYFAVYLDSSMNDERLGKSILAVVVILLAIYQLHIEARQLLKQGCNYWKSPQNIIDLTVGFLTIAIVLSSLIDETRKEARVVAIGVIIAMGAKAVLDWLRLFDETAFYVSLVLQTLFDVGYFGVIFFLVLAYFGIALYMTQLNAGEENLTVNAVFGNFFIDSLLNEYLLILGEFYMDGFEKEPAILYLLFVATTFISQIVFFNMLIAIMGDTFGRVIEQKPTHSLKNKLLIMATMACMIEDRKSSGQQQDFFIYVIQRKEVNDEDMMMEEEDDDEDNWQGTFFKLSNFMKRNFQQLKDQMDRQQQEARAINSRFDAQQQEARAINSKLDAQQQTLNSILEILKKGQ